MNRFLFHVPGSNRTFCLRYYICDVKVKKAFIESIYQQVNMNTWQTFYMHVYTGVFLFIRDKKHNYKLISNLLYVYTVFFIRDKNTHFAIKIKKMTLQIHLKFNSNESACHTDSFMQCEYEWSISSYYRAWQV